LLVVTVAVDPSGTAGANKEDTLLRLAALFVAWCFIELTLVLMLADYASWQVALLEILASGLLGAAVIRYVTSHFGRRVVARLRASEFPGDTLADGALLFIAGVLLIVPGVMSDVVGVLLLIPPVRWLVVAWLKRRWRARAEAFRVRFADSHLSDDPSAGGVILEGHVVDDHSHTAE
jgi:UPF0716 protein FxsA